MSSSRAQTAETSRAQTAETRVSTASTLGGSIRAVNFASKLMGSSLKWQRRKRAQLNVQRERDLVDKERRERAKIEAKRLRWEKYGPFGEGFASTGLRKEECVELSLV